MENLLSEAINWWENILTHQQRNEIMTGSWDDIGENNPEGIKKRHTWLLEQYNKFN